MPRTTIFGGTATDEPLLAREGRAKGSERHVRKHRHDTDDPVLLVDAHMANERGEDPERLKERQDARHAQETPVGQQQVRRQRSDHLREERAAPRRVGVSHRESN